MEPTTSPTDSSQTPLATGKTGTSALGGAKAITDRLSSFIKGRESGEQPTDKSKLPLPEKKEKAPAPEGSTTDKVNGTGKDKAPDKKDAPTDKDKIGTDGLTKEERAQVVEFKKRAETAESRLKELETKHQEGEATAKELAELKKLNQSREADYDRNEREIAAIRIMGSKKYQETIARPMQALTAKIQEIAKGCNLDADAVFGTIGMTDLVKRNNALKDYLDSMDPLTAETFKQSVNALLDLEPKAHKLITESREAWQALQIEEKEAGEREAQLKRETYLKASDAVWKEMQDKLPMLNKEDITKHVRAKADNFDFSKADPDILAYMVQSGYSMKYMQEAIDAKDQEIAQLKASVSRLGGERIGPADGATSDRKEAAKFEGSTSGDRWNLFNAGRR